MLFTGEMVALVMNITSYSCMILVIKTRNSATPLSSPASGFGCRGIDAPELAHHPLVDAFAADVADRKYSSDYLQAESAAKRAGAGIWRGEFTPPGEWRATRR